MHSLLSCKRQALVTSAEFSDGCGWWRQVRKGYFNGEDNTHTWISQAPSWGVSAATLHGRTRQQRWGTQSTARPTHV